MISSKIRIYTFIVLALLYGLNLSISSAKTIYKSLYINQGEFKTIIQSVKFPSHAFNESPTFSQVNSLITAEMGDSLILTIQNNHNVNHQFFIQDISSSAIDIASNSSKVYKLKLTKKGCFIYYDPSNAPVNRYLGLGGMLVVKSANDSSKSFYWNIKEHTPNFNKLLSSGQMVNWENYYPDYFTVNSFSHPESETDTLATIKGSVGDTITIYLCNTAVAEHAMHFHGFHVDIMETNQNKKLESMSKDSFPLKSMQTMILRLVLDKKGAYPVHDHNLLAMTGGSVHPYGMMVLIHVDYP